VIIINADRKHFIAEVLKVSESFLNLFRQSPFSEKVRSQKFI